MPRNGGGTQIFGTGFCRRQKIMRAKRTRFFKAPLPVSREAMLFAIRASFTNSRPSGCGTDTRRSPAGHAPPDRIDFSKNGSRNGIFFRKDVPKLFPSHFPPQKPAFHPAFPYGFRIPKFGSRLSGGFHFSQGNPVDQVRGGFHFMLHIRCLRIYRPA